MALPQGSLHERRFAVFESGLLENPSYRQVGTFQLVLEGAGTKNRGPFP